MTIISTQSNDLKKFRNNNQKLTKIYSVKFARLLRVYLMIFPFYIHSMNEINKKMSIESERGTRRI